MARSTRPTRLLASGPRAGRRLRAALPAGKTLEDVLEEIREALRVHYETREGEKWVWNEATTDGTVVVEVDGKRYRHSWATDEVGAIVISSDRTEVVREVTYEPAGEPARVAASAATWSLRLTASAGRVFEAVVFRAGFNSVRTPGPAFEGLRGYVDDDEAGLGSLATALRGAVVYYWPPNRGVLDHVQLSDGDRKWFHAKHRAGYVTEITRAGGEVRAKIALDPEVPEWLATLVEASANPELDPNEKPVGLSIDSYAARAIATRDGERVALMHSFQGGRDGPISIDVVSFPAAGGEFVQKLAAARHGGLVPMTYREALKILASADATDDQRKKAAEALARFATDSESTAEIRDGAIAALASIGKTPTAPATPAPAAEPAATPAAASAPATPAPAAPAQLEVAPALASSIAAGVARIARFDAEQALDRALASASLPRAHAAELRSEIVRRLDAPNSELVGDPARVTAAVEHEVSRLRALFSDDARVLDAGGARVEYIGGRHEKMRVGMEQILLGNAPPAVLEAYARDAHGGETLQARASRLGIRREDAFTSLHDHVRVFTGQDPRRLFSGQSSDALAVRASLSTDTYSVAWGDTIQRAVVAYYSANELDPMPLVRKVNASDFRTRRNVHFGGYGDLAIVGERAPYPALSTPAERSNSYALATRGGTEDWSRQASVNDDVKLLQSIPRRLGRAAKRTLFKFVTDLMTIAGQPTMDYDATALFHANHGNLGTTAMSEAQIAADHIAMLQQTDFASGEELGIAGVFLLYPTALVKTAWDATKPLDQDPGGMTTDRSYIANSGLRRFRVPTWTNAKDWCLYADPNEYEGGFELAFLNGQEMPQILVADGANVGAMFMRDVTVIRIRHEYSGAFASHQGILINDVA